MIEYFVSPNVPESYVQTRLNLLNTQAIQQMAQRTGEDILSVNADGTAVSLVTSGASEVLADGQRVRLTWKPQHTFVIGPAAGPLPTGNPELEEPQTHA